MRCDPTQFGFKHLQDDFYNFSVEGVETYGLSRMMGAWSVNRKYAGRAPGFAWEYDLVEGRKIESAQDLLDMLREAGALEPIAHYRAVI